MKRAQRKIFNNLILWAFFMCLGSLIAGSRVHAINISITKAVGDGKIVATAESNTAKASVTEPTVNTNNTLNTTAMTKVAEPESLTYTDQWLCRKSNEVRTLRVEKKQGACVALYNKLGRNQTINSSKNSENCSPIIEKVKGNLESAGWKCKDISDSQITE